MKIKVFLKVPIPLVDENFIQGPVRFKGRNIGKIISTKKTKVPGQLECCFEIPLKTDFRQFEAMAQKKSCSFEVYAQ